MRRIKWKNPIKIRWKIKISHSPKIEAKLHLSANLTLFFLKTVRDRENLLIYCWKLSMRRINWKKSHQNLMKNKIFPFPTKWRKITIFSQFDPFILKTVRDRKNLLAYYWKLSMRRIKWKKSHWNQMKNKKFPSPAKSHFKPLLPLYIKTVGATKNCLE